MRHFLLLAVVSSTLMGQTAPATGGTLRFEDGSTLKFREFQFFSYTGCPSEAQAMNESGGREATFRVEYQNSNRDVPVSAIRSIRLTSFVWGGCQDALGIGEFQVETKTGVMASARRGGPMGVRVSIIDDLTGEVKSQAFTWARNRGPSDHRILLRQIDFEP